METEGQKERQRDIDERERENKRKEKMKRLKSNNTGNIQSVPKDLDKFHTEAD